MRKIVRSFLLAATPALLTLSLSTHEAHAQGKKAGGKKPPTTQPGTGAAAGTGGAAKPIDIDAAPTGQPAAKPDLGPPPTAGQMTPEAAKAKRDFDQEKWEKAALGLSKVQKGETNDDEGNKQLAQYHLAISLYHLRFYQAAYGIFSEIADKPNHLKFNETLLWLARLATELPEPADIVERVGKYDEGQIAKFNNANQRDLYWQLNYLLGRYKYRNRQYDDAIKLFSKVAKQSKWFVKSQFFTGISHVQLRRSVPAVKAFQSIVSSIDDGADVEDETRMRDLAFLSMARTYYSASVTLDENNTPKILEDRLSAAVKYWNTVDVGSEYWLDALFEESWAYFMAGDYSRALGNIHTIQSPYFPNSYYPEAEVLKAVIYFSNCQYDDSTTIVSKFQQKYQPLSDELNVILNGFKGDNQEEAFYGFLKDVRDNKAKQLDKKGDLTKTVVKSALSDRQLLRHIKYVELLDEEQKRFDKATPEFKGSALGLDTKDALSLARDIAVKNAGALAKERYQRNIDELSEHLRNSAKILIDITAAQRNQLDAAIAGAQVTAKESERNIVKADEEHVIWPFKGEYWRDELGFYRQTITSRCGR